MKESVFAVGLLTVLIFSAVVSAEMADLEREQRLKDQIIDAIFDGEPIDLEADGHEFLGIYTEADDAVGGVLILHGRGYHPDWDTVVKPLRVGLTDSAWNTLSIQLPVLEKDAKYYDYEPLFDEAVPRIKAGLDYLKQQGNQKVILIAHSCGAHMAMQYVRKLGEAGFDAYIGIGMGATDFKQPMREPLPLDKMKKPLLDIYGSNDYPAVQRLAAIRNQMMAGEGNPLNRQIVVEGADHYFNEMGAPLLQVVSDWLEALKN